MKFGPQKIHISSIMTYNIILIWNWNKVAVHAYKSKISVSLADYKCTYSLCMFVLNWTLLARNEQEFDGLYFTYGNRTLK